MARTKRRVQEVVEEVLIGTQEQQEQTNTPQADDQTALNDLAKKREEKEVIPDGFKKRLPAGNVRDISVVHERIGKKGKVIRIVDHTAGKTIVTDACKIEGESELVHDIEHNCGLPTGKGRVVLRTQAPILIGRSTRY